MTTPTPQATGTRRINVGALVLVLAVALVAGVIGVAKYRDHQQQQDRIDRMTNAVFCEQQQLVSYEECMG